MSDSDNGSGEVWPRGGRRAAIRWSTECIAILLVTAWSASVALQDRPIQYHHSYADAVAIVSFSALGGIPVLVIPLVAGHGTAVAAAMGFWLVVWWIGLKKIRSKGSLKTWWLTDYMIFCILLFILMSGLR